MPAPSIATSSSGTGSSITLPAGMAAGDLLVVFVQASGTSSGGGKAAATVSVIDSNGKTYELVDFSQGSSTNGAVVKVSGLLSRVWDGTEGTLSCYAPVISSPTFTWVCWRIPGGIVDVKASSLQATGTTFSFPSVTTTGPDRLILLAGMAGTPTTAIDTATVSGATNVDGARSGTTIAGRVWSFTQAVADATGAKTSSTVASSGSTLDAYTVAIKSSVKTYSVTANAASTPAGSLRKSIAKSALVSSTAPPRLLRSVTKPRGVTTTPAPGFTLRRPFTLIAVLATAASLPSFRRSVARSLGGAAANLASLARVTGLNRTVTTTPLSALIKALAKALRGSGTGSPSVMRQIGKPRGAQSGAVPSLRKVTGLNRMAVTQPVAAIRKAMARRFAAVASMQGSLSKRLARSLAGLATIAGSIFAGRIIPVQVGADGTAVGALIKTAGRGIFASAPGVAALRRALAKFIRSGTQPVGRLMRLAGRSFRGAANASGSLRRGVARAFFATTTPVGRVARHVARAFQAAASPLARVIRTAFVAVKASTSAEASLIRRVGKLIRAEARLSGSIRRAAARSFTALGRPRGRLTRDLRKAFETATAPMVSLSLARRFGLALGAAANTAGSLARGLRKAITAQTRPEGALAYVTTLLLRIDLAWLLVPLRRLRDLKALREVRLLAAPRKIRAAVASINRTKLVEFSPKTPDEILNLSIDFRNNMPVAGSIASAEVRAEVVAGEDPNPDGFLTGNPAIIGTAIVQRTQGGIPGATYKLRYFGTMNDGQIIELQGLIAVVETIP